VCPSFFQQFNDHLVEDDPEREKARANGMRLRQTGMGQHFANGIQGAASKWRLAKSVTGLRYDDSTGVSEGLAESYSAQARVAMSVVAFEAFARIFTSRHWPIAQPVVTTNTDTGLDLSRFDAALLIAFTATKETDYGTETDGRIPPRCSADRTDQWAYAQTGG
jgi:hypothetical protein